MFEDLHEVKTGGREPLVSLSATTLALMNVLKWTGLVVCKMEEQVVCSLFANNK